MLIGYKVTEYISFNPPSPPAPEKFKITLDERPNFSRKKMAVFLEDSTKLELHPKRGQVLVRKISKKSPVRQDSTKPKLPTRKGKLFADKKLKYI